MRRGYFVRSTIAPLPRQSVDNQADSCGHSMVAKWRAALCSGSIQKGGVDNTEWADTEQVSIMEQDKQADGQIKELSKRLTIRAFVLRKLYTGKIHR